MKKFNNRYFHYELCSDSSGSLIIWSISTDNGDFVTEEGQHKHKIKEIEDLIKLKKKELKKLEKTLECLNKIDIKKIF